MSETPRWFNSLGEEVDLDDIDREYALNILIMAVRTRGAQGVPHSDLVKEPLILKLREIVLHGREPGDEDRRRANRYNRANARLGLRWRAR